MPSSEDSREFLDTNYNNLWLLVQKEPTDTIAPMARRLVRHNLMNAWSIFLLAQKAKDLSSSSVVLSFEWIGATNPNMRRNPKAPTWRWETPIMRFYASCDPRYKRITICQESLNRIMTVSENEVSIYFRRTLRRYGYSVLSMGFFTKEESVRQICLKGLVCYSRCNNKSA